MKNKTGFSPIVLIIILALLAGGGYYVWKNQTPTATPTVITDTNIEPPVTPSTPSVDTANWKTYRNEGHGFAFEYLATWKIDTKYASSDPGNTSQVNILPADSKGKIGIRFYSIGPAYLEVAKGWASTEAGDPDVDRVYNATPNIKVIEFDSWTNKPGPPPILMGTVNSSYYVVDTNKLRYAILDFSYIDEGRAYQEILNSQGYKDLRRGIEQIITTLRFTK